MGKVPHLVQYQGSKRNLANKIIQYIPKNTKRLVEPFSGTAAITMACAFNNIAKEFLINDLNTPLINLLKNVIDNPEYVSTEYEKVWNAQLKDSENHFYIIRDDFNRTQNPVEFLYLLARCVKGSVRYNSKGQFNQSPDKRRKGTNPLTMANNIFSISNLLKDRVSFFSLDYKEILAMTDVEDVIYMDPPYQGVCGNRDSRYFAAICHEEFVEQLKHLNNTNKSFIVSYDGKLGNKTYGKEFPEEIGLKHIFLQAGQSSQSTLLGRKEETLESLYISKTLYEKEIEEYDALFERVS